MARKSRPSFDAPKSAAAAKQPGWVYRSGEPAAPVVDTTVVESTIVRTLPPEAPAHPLDLAVMPLTLLVMAALVPVSWLRGKR